MIIHMQLLKTAVHLLINDNLTFPNLRFFYDLCFNNEEQRKCVIFRDPLQNNRFLNLT